MQTIQWRGQVILKDEMSFGDVVGIVYKMQGDEAWSGFSTIFCRAVMNEHGKPEWYFLPKDWDPYLRANDSDPDRLIKNYGEKLLLDAFDIYFVWLSSKGERYERYVGTALLTLNAVSLVGILIASVYIGTHGNHPYYSIMESPWWWVFPAWLALAVLSAYLMHWLGTGWRLMRLKKAITKSGGRMMLQRIRDQRQAGVA